MPSKSLLFSVVEKEAFVISGLLLAHPIGREKLATEFIRHGGTVLQKLLGCFKIATTMKHVHVDEHMMVQAILALDEACRLGIS